MISATASPRAAAAARQTWAMSRRSITAILRQPATVAPAMIFPLFFAALGASSFSRATMLPGFPEVDSFLDFALAGAIIQGVLFGSTTGGTALATDIENGFFDRLLASPTSRTSILIGRLAGAAVFGAVQTVVFSAVLMAFGVTIKSGPVGMVVLVLSGALIGLGIGGLMAAMALKTGSAEAVQGAFPLLFILLFFSSAFFPRETMTGVYRRIADVNPISYMVEGVRNLVIDGLTLTSTAEALLIPIAISVFSISLSLVALRRRVAAA